MRNFMFPLYESTGPGGGGGSQEPSDDIETDLEILDSEDETDEDEGEEEDEETDKKEDKEDDEEDDDDEPLLGDLDSDEEEEDERPKKGKKADQGEETEDEEEEEVSAEPERDERGRPTIKAIKSKYPQIFKDFPELKRSYFALPRYEEFFADPEQAQEASEKSREFDELEESLVGRSDPSGLIKTLAENNPRSLQKMISNFASAVKEHYNEGYIALARPILEELVYTAFQHATKVGDKNLQLSARHMANFVWSNGGEIPDISKRATKAEPSEAEKELEAQKNKTDRTLFMTAVKDIMPRAETSLNGLLSQNLKGLTKFERNAVLGETLRQTNSKLNADKAFQISISRLWDRAKAEDYSDASKRRVLDAWLSRARSVAIPIRNKLREEALGAHSEKGNRSDVKREGKRTFPSSGGREVKKGTRVLDPSKIDWSKTSDMDILNSK